MLTELQYCFCIHIFFTASILCILRALRASARETRADLEMRVGRFRLTLVHNLVMGTYVICQCFSFNELFLAEFWISAPQGSSVQFWPLFNLSFSNVQLILDKKKTIFVMPYS